MIRKLITLAIAMSLPLQSFGNTSAFTEFAGEWGFDSFESTPGPWANELQVSLLCGSPKQYVFSFYEESWPDHSRHQYLRRHPDQATGELITEFTTTKLVTEFLGNVSTFELRKDGRLVTSFSGTRVLLKRCQSMRKRHG